MITREDKVLFFAPYLGKEVIFDEKIIGELRGIHLDGLMNLDVIEEWDNNTPIYKKWDIEDTKLLLNREEASLIEAHFLKECIYLK